MSPNQMGAHRPATAFDGFFIIGHGPFFRRHGKRLQQLRDGLVFWRFFRGLGHDGRIA